MVFFYSVWPFARQLLLLTLALKSSSVPTSDLHIEQTVILARHSVRSLRSSRDAALGVLLVGGQFPILMRGPHRATYGQLTEVGIQKAKELGAALRRRYVDELGLLPATLDQDNIKKLKLRSTRMARCVESIFLVREGIYPDVRSLPLYSESKEKYQEQLVGGQHPASALINQGGKIFGFLGILLRAGSWSLNDIEYLRKYILDMQAASAQELVLPIEVRSRVYETLTPPLTSFQDLAAASSRVVFEQMANQLEPLQNIVLEHLPEAKARHCNLRDFLEVAAANNLQFQSFIDVTTFRDAWDRFEINKWSRLSENKNFHAQGAGVWLDELLTTLEAKVSGAADSPSVILNLAHDSSLLMVMPLFGGCPHWPTYNDHLAVELWNSGGPNEWYVRLRYNDGLIQLPDCVDPDPNQPDKTLHPWRLFWQVFNAQRTRSDPGASSSS